MDSRNTKKFLKAANKKYKDKTLGFAAQHEVVVTHDLTNLNFGRICNSDEQPFADDNSFYNYNSKNMKKGKGIAQFAGAGFFNADGGNSTFPDGSWAQTELTPVGDPAQGVYQDSNNYLYQDSGDGKTLYDLGSQSYIDYNGNPVAAPSTGGTTPSAPASSGSSSSTISSVANAISSIFGKSSTPAKPTTPIVKPTVTSTSSWMQPVLIVGGLAVAGFLVYKYALKKKK